jgi:phenylpropionate dioxygenase-like ring-hydroxylating dioxygenase large terminal subunit
VLNQGFDWRHCWYPVTLVEDLPRERPTPIAIHDLRLVLFRDDDGTLGCLRDRCPHRAARLSDGQVTNGNLECLYHGWRFDVSGHCVAIPQLARNSEIPAKARASSYAAIERQGIAWVWAGDAAQAATDDIPIIGDLDRPGFTSIDFMMDLPYGQSYLVENVIDIAHIHIAHDGVRGGGHRELAAPLQFTVLENTVKGIRSTFGSVRDGPAPDAPSLRGSSVTFVAPNLVWYESHYADETRSSGLALYSLPLSESRCRLIYRAYSNFPRWIYRLTPRAAQHWTQCTILEQDMRVVMGQAEEIEQADKPLRELWLPIKSSDALVIQYRKWLDEHGSSMPSCRGFATSPTDRRAIPTEVPRVDRFSLHTKICASCSRAHRAAARASTAFISLTVVLLAVGVLSSGTALSVVATMAALAAGIGVVASRAVERRFE